MKLRAEQIKQFQSLVLPFYHPPLYRDLPWRRTDDPYAILVSEIMLQQTQVARVIEKYKAWIKRFPTVYELAQTDMSAVLPYWVGLGYNRRAVYLHTIAGDIVNNYRGIFPSSPEALMKLPGVGHYTARALCVFGYDQPHVLLETNTRTVYIHHFFQDKDGVSDDELTPLIEQTMDRQNPRKWFNALFDYGSSLKEQFPNPARKSRHYVKQKPLSGSVREVRGWIIKQISSGKPLEISAVDEAFPSSSARIKQAIEGLSKDELILKQGRFLKLKT